MGQPQTKYDFWEGIGKFIMGAAYIAIGIMAKLAIDSKEQKLTRTQLWAKISISFTIGFCSFMACSASGHIKWAGVVTPISTMLGETISIYIFTHINQWMDWFSDKFKKK